MRERNSQKSKEDILAAAEIEFSDKGIYGARIDEIAARADINKRMIYEYFGSKEELYKNVLVIVYGRLGQKEDILLSEKKSEIEVIKQIILLYFNFLKENPTYVNLILWENLNKGKYIREVNISGVRNHAFDLLRQVIESGKSGGIFRKDVDTEQVLLSLLTYTFSYFSNKYTLSILLGTKMDNEDNIRNRAENVTEMILQYLMNQEVVKK